MLHNKELERICRPQNELLNGKEKIYYIKYNIMKVVDQKGEDNIY